MSDYEDLNAAAQFLQLVGAQVGAGQVMPKPADDEVEWRGTSYNFPCRIKLDAFRSPEINLKLHNPHGTCDLDWDPETVPRPGAPYVPPWDDTDSVKVFVGHGVCIDGFADSVDEELAVFQKLPAALTGPIVQTMQRENIRYFRMRDDEIEVDFHDDLGEMQQPHHRVATVAQFAGWVAAYLVGTPAAASTEGQPGKGPANAVHKVPCRTCGSVFLWGTAQVCVNCGTPPNG